MANANGNGFGARRRRARRVQQKRKTTQRTGGAGTSFWLKALGGLAALAFCALFAAAIGAIVVYRSYADQLVAPDERAINQPSFGAKIYDRNGKLLYEYVDDHSGLRRPVKLENVSEAFLAATIATEDDSFFSNPGVNIKGLGRAAWENFSPLSSTPGVLGGSGGSSITQQLVKNVYIAQEERQKRSISRKLKETVFAIELTNRYEKERILEWYVNQISYGGVYNGVEAASQGYFGKSARDLTIGEAAMLAGIPQSPAAYDPVNHAEASTERRNQILDILEHKGTVRIGKDRHYQVNPEELAAAKEQPIDIAVKRFPIEAPHFVLQYVQPQLEQLLGREALYRDGLVVNTTLDLDLQYETQAIMEKWIREFENTSNSHNGSMMVMDPKSGEVLVMIGSRDYFREDIEGKNNNATACNSPGSSFKPFAYLTAFLELGWGPGTFVLDTPVSYPESDGTSFTPVNPGKNFQGPITVRNALGNSLNIPAVKTAAAVGPDKIVNQARKMGFMQTFRLRRDGGCSVQGGYGPAIATGGVDVTLEEMMFGYSVFANGGVMRGQESFSAQARRANERQIDPVAILKVTDAQGRTRYDVEQHRKQERIVKEDYTYLVSNILSDPSAECITFGCGGISVPGRQVAVKTGTSEPFESRGPNAGKIGETWAFGYSPDYVVGIWAGNSNNAPVVNIFSTSISFRSMRDVMLAAYAGRPGTPFNRPEGVVQDTVCVPSGLKPSPLCAKTTTDLIAKDKVPTKEDDWWQRVRIDVRTGLLATPGTPFQFTEEKVMLVLPPDLVKNPEDRKRADEWAQALGLTVAPTETSPALGVVPFPGAPTIPTAPGAVPSLGGAASDIFTAILSPTAGQNVTANVPVIGRAFSTAFDSYKLEYGRGASPTTWLLIAQSNTPVQAGTLGSWNATALAADTYVLRLTVKDRQRGDLVSSVSVRVGGGAPALAVPGGPTPAAPPLAP
jgi:membrane peptidoglycan carboxypeptidase